MKQDITKHIEQTNTDRRQDVTQIGQTFEETNDMITQINEKLDRQYEELRIEIEDLRRETEDATFRFRKQFSLHKNFNPDERLFGCERNIENAIEEKVNMLDEKVYIIEGRVENTAVRIQNLNDRVENTLENQIKNLEEAVKKVEQNRGQAVIVRGYGRPEVEVPSFYEYKKVPMEFIQCLKDYLEDSNEEEWTKKK